MASTTSKGNYYKRKTKEYYEKLGYTVQLTEFVCATVIRGKCFYRKIDIFSSDGISINGVDIIFWNSKHTVTGDISNVKSEGKKELSQYPFPSFVKKQVVIWEPRKLPVIIEV